LKKEENRMAIEIHLAKHLSKPGDWCGCCGKLVPENTPMIVLKTPEGNRHISQHHMQIWITNENEPKLFFKKPQGE
jgi:hypothetical protein